MANATLRILLRDVSLRLKIRMDQVRHGHHLRGKPPTIARTLQQRLESLNENDPTISFKVDIGFSVPKLSKQKKEAWLAERKVKRLDVNFQKQVRAGQWSADLEEARAIWSETCSPFHVRRIADHYGVFQDLFGDAFFLPVVPLTIEYKVDDDASSRVYTGNVIKPAEACHPPHVGYRAENDTLWTLVMCTPDGNMENSSDEYCHWFLGNIPGSKVEKGEQIIDYMRPIPVRGVGYYRYTFILYKQERRLNYADYKKAEPCLQLKERTWNTLDFYRKYQDDLTPAGLAFFQSDWDSTVREFYHSALDAEEPIFEYDFPKPYLKPQQWFPLRQPFNIYLEKYRDPRDVMKEYLLRKLRSIDPLKKPKPPLKYPNACSIDHHVPSWLKYEMKKERLGWGRVNYLK